MNINSFHNYQGTFNMGSGNLDPEIQPESSSSLDAEDGAELHVIAFGLRFLNT